MTENIETCRVLIVDDEPEMCSGVRKILKNFSVFVEDTNTNVNFEVDSAVSKDEFFAFTKSQNYGIILLDYKMPDVSGLELLEYIINQNKNALVIMITAYATFETAVESTKLGAYDFLPKPFNPVELRNSIRKAATRYILSRKAQEFEEERKRIRFRFISVLSHELKAPLNAIEGYLDILETRRDKISSDDFGMMINRSKVRIDGMRKLIFDLLDLTRIESGEKKRNIENIDLNKLVNSSIELFSEDAKRRNIDITFENRGVNDFCADKTEIEIILNNLISNAVKYNKDNGKVRVRVSQANNKTRITIADNGIGMSAEEKNRLFKEFSRIKNDKTMHILGSGLGLYTLNKIVQFYLGTISVKSRPDKGTAFSVSLFA